MCRSSPCKPSADDDNSFSGGARLSEMAFCDGTVITCPHQKAAYESLHCKGFDINTHHKRGSGETETEDIMRRATGATESETIFFYCILISSEYVNDDAEVILNMTM